MRDRLRVRHCVYHWLRAEGEEYRCGTYSKHWRRRYDRRCYRRIDPVVIDGFRRFDPVDWKELDWSGKAARAYRRDALDHGVGSQGFSIPLRGPNGQFALFSVTDTTSDAAWAEFTAARQPDLILVGHYLNRKALELAGPTLPAPSRSLSPREIEALTYLAQGYGRGRVADVLSISEHTLRAYIESARFKLGAANTTHAVARAAMEGLIVVGAAPAGPGTRGAAAAPPR
ncbi:autoinducer-binding transcriptional regulator LuxR [Oceanicola granulosus HTCC2516]|uniref:Autoinducer-binding transcriptional regulator LuxR n=2 Tax=Oceanicola granulosus TaxID=252302 RepID=Q2CI49_OCEGH|nr:autoinducer-binding transcriptional regulator LuxR [Oceanicola granulosus HTCC2516]